MNRIKNLNRKFRFAFMALALAAIGIAALTVGKKSSAQTGQASLSLKNADVVLCQKNDTEWTLDKSVSSSNLTDGIVTWTVNAVKGETTDDMLKVDGYVEITNSGSQPAPIGNIVVNLQRQRAASSGSKWVSASVDVANRASGDAATTANIVAAGSQEDAALNATYNSPATYSLAGAKGTFSENAGSGTLEFTDASNNTVWALSSAQIAGGASVKLFFVACFNNTVLGIPAGESVRAEVIATFGNAGGRGGGGATATNIDISGNGSPDPFEANVRSVPTRLTRNVPVVEACNSTVTLRDTGVTTSGTVTYGSVDYLGYDAGVAITDSTTFSITATGVKGGTDGGTICNDVKLTGPSSTVSVIAGYTTVLDVSTYLNVQVPTYAQFPCCEGLKLSDSACVTVPGEVITIPPILEGDYCTYSQGGFGGKGAPFILLKINFGTVFPSGIEVGIPGASGYSMKFSTAAKVQSYLPDGSTAGKLTSDLTDPTSSASGVLGAQILTLKINIALGDAGAMGNYSTPKFGDLYLCGTGGSLKGKQVREILAAAETALGGGVLPAGYSYSTLNDLIDNLNIKAFHECSLGSFASNLSRTPCP